uniref:lysylphosphatidylglycerol synthase transmembrane domain-containing protein n=1 Tax=Pseudomonas sp. LRF_L74 TaxID=3369422 RepID=UPI003F5F578F
MDVSSTRDFRQSWGYRATIYSTVLSASGYLAFSLWGGWHEVVQALLRVGVLGLSFALLMSLINYALRFLRWQTYLQALGHPLPTWRISLRIYIAGFALSTTPGKVGEAIRSALLKEYGMPYSRSLAALLSERLSDLVAITLMVTLGLAMYHQARTLALVGTLAIVPVLLLLSRHRFIQRVSDRIVDYPGKIMGLLRHLLSMFLDARQCHTPGLLIRSTLLSLTAWGAEALAFHVLLHWIGADLPLTSSVFIYSASTLAGALSFMPGGLGGTEAVMVALLLGNGLSHADAVAITLIIRFTTLWFAVALGAVALGQRQHRPDNKAKG